MVTFPDQGCLPRSMRLNDTDVEPVVREGQTAGIDATVLPSSRYSMHVGLPCAIAIGSMRLRTRLMLGGMLAALR